MNGLEMPTGEKILLDGEEVMSNGKKIARIRQRIGMVFQSYELFPHKNIMDNIILAPVKVQKRPRKEVELQAEQMHITRFWTDAGMHFLRIIRKFWHGRSIEALGNADEISPAVQKGNTSLLDWLNDEIRALGEERFFHADYEATLAPVYGEAVDPDNLVVEGGKIE